MTYNFPNMYTNLNCDNCGKKEETQEHTLTCEGETLKCEYKEIFGNRIKKMVKIVNEMQKIMRKRKNQ